MTERKTIQEVGGEISIRSLPIGWGAVVTSFGMNSHGCPALVHLEPVNPGEQVPGETCANSECYAPEGHAPGLHFKDFDAMRKFGQAIIDQANRLEADNG